MMVTLKAVRDIVDELAVGGGISKSACVVESRMAVSKNFVMRFVGEACAGTNRVAALLGNLRRPSGVWRQVQLQAQKDEGVPLYLLEDRSPRIVWQHVLLRRLVKCLREVHDGRQVFFLRDNVTISFSWRVLARVVCETKEGGPQVE